MTFDLEKHEENKMKFLTSLYEMVEEHKNTDPKAETLFIAPHQGDIGEKAGFSPQETNDIGSELQRDGLTKYWSTGESGPSTGLTHEGLRVLRQHLYDNSPLTVKRKRKAWVIAKATELAKLGAGKILAGFGRLLIGALAVYRSDVIKWVINRLFGW